MKAFSFTVLVALASAGPASAFTLEKRDDMVCRVDLVKPAECLTSVEAMGLPNLAEIDLLAKVRSFKTSLSAPKSDNAVAHGGSARFLSEAQADDVLSKYAILSLRNLAVGDRPKFLQDGYAFMPFYASLRWQSARSKVLNGTIHLEGYVRILKRDDVAGIEISDEAAAAVAGASNTIALFDYEDSQTEWNHPGLRFIEKAARYVHFNLVGTDGKTVDAATKSVFTSIVAPMVYLEIADMLRQNLLKQREDDGAKNHVP